jgi:hypothetical protein
VEFPLRRKTVEVVDLVVVVVAEEEKLVEREHQVKVTVGELRFRLIVPVKVAAVVAAVREQQEAMPQLQLKVEMVAMDLLHLLRVHQ